MKITREMLDEMDRNARAYGWEIGKGKPLTAEMEISPDNPFTDKNWQANMVATDDVLSKAIECFEDDWKPILWAQATEEQKEKYKKLAADIIQLNGNDKPDEEKS